MKFCAFKVPPDPSPWGEEISQASRRISTARLNASLRLRPRPIEVVVYDRALGHYWREDLSWGRLGA